MVASSYDPVIGGAETVIRNLATELNRNGIQTDIMTFNMNKKWKPRWQGKEQRDDGIKIIRIPALNWFPTAHSNRITFGVNLIPGRFTKHLKNYDVLHFHGEDLTLPLFSYNVKKPKIFHSHGFSLDFCKNFVGRLILKNIADLYISISRRMTNEYAQLGIPSNKIRYLPNAVDVKLFRSSKEKDNDLILFIGRVNFNKGLHVLLDSLHHVTRPVHLVIIGPCSWDVAYFKRMQQRIIDENIKGMHKITYVGAQEKASVATWLRRATIYVSPSFVEAFASSIMEALSSGTAVIATDVGGVSEVITHGKNGILVPPNSPIKLAESIQYLLDNEDVRVRLARRGRRDVVWRFCQEVVVKRLVEIYEEITGQN
jgi:glycosyltransferase involved in cell wall biosynthesis